MLQDPIIDQVTRHRKEAAAVWVFHRHSKRLWRSNTNVPCKWEKVPPTPRDSWQNRGPKKTWTTTQRKR